MSLLRPAIDKAERSTRILFRSHLYPAPGGTLYQSPVDINLLEQVWLLIVFNDSRYVGKGFYRFPLEILFLVLLIPFQARHHAVDAPPESLHESSCDLMRSPIDEVPKSRPLFWSSCQKCYIKAGLAGGVQGNANSFPSLWWCPWYPPRDQAM